MRIPNDIDDYESDDTFPYETDPPPDMDDPDYVYDSMNDVVDKIEERFIETFCKHCDFWQDGCLIINSRYWQWNGCFEFENMDAFVSQLMKEGDI